ncbi:hypothetical protein M2092_002196, partial [Fusobacterium sp. PH5-44]
DFVPSPNRFVISSNSCKNNKEKICISQLPIFHFQAIAKLYYILQIHTFIIL